MIKHLLAIFFICVPFLLQSQDFAEDSSFVAYAVKNAILESQKEFKESVLLHTGGEYYDYDIRVEGFPYFIEDYFVPGSVILDGRPYQNIQIKYDIHKDLLVLEHYDGNGYLQELELVSGKIDSFKIHGYDFFRLRENDSLSDELDAGFYNLLYQGNVDVLSKRYKEYHETINNMDLLKEFLLKDKFYIIKDSRVFQVRNKRSVMQVFKADKKALKNKLRAYHPDFKHDFENALITTVKVYDEMAVDGDKPNKDE